MEATRMKGTEQGGKYGLPVVVSHKLTITTKQNISL